MESWAGTLKSEYRASVILIQMLFLDKVKTVNYQSTEKTSLLKKERIYIHVMFQYYDPYAKLENIL